MARIRTYHELSEGDGSDLAGQVRRQAERVVSRLRNVRHVVAVTSGKGGVGKSLLAAGLAAAARAGGHRVALLDADLHGPTAGRLLGAAPEPLRVRGDAVEPAETAAGVALMSASLLLEEGTPLEWREPEGDGFAWRSAQERGAVREFLSDVDWGSRDLLLVDLPPGSQRLLEVAELVPGLRGALTVTLPSPASRAAVERSLALCRRRGLPLLGVVENMAGYRCPGCASVSPLFGGAAGEELSERFDVPLLARVPFDPEAAARAEAGDPAGLLDSAVGELLLETARTLMRRLEDG